MTYTRRTPHRPEKPDSAATIAGMRAKAATPEALARVEALGQRWGVGAEMPAPKRQTNRSHKLGMAAEGHARKALQEAGYVVTTSQDSKGAADLTAVKREHGTEGPLVRAVQVKMLSAFASWGLNEAVSRFLGLNRWAREGEYRVAHGATRESWLWIYRIGWVAVAVLDADGALTVTGKEPYRKAVEGSLRTSIARGRAAEPVTNEAARKPRISKRTTTQ